MRTEHRRAVLEDKSLVDYDFTPPDNPAEGKNTDGHNMADEDNNKDGNGLEFSLLKLRKLFDSLAPSDYTFDLEARALLAKATELYLETVVDKALALSDPGAKKRMSLAYDQLASALAGWCKDKAIKDIVPQRMTGAEAKRLLQERLEKDAAMLMLNHGPTPGLEPPPPPPPTSAPPTAATAPSSVAPPPPPPTQPGLADPADDVPAPSNTATPAENATVSQPQQDSVVAPPPSSLQPANNEQESQEGGHASAATAAPGEASGPQPGT